MSSLASVSLMYQSYRDMLRIPEAIVALFAAALIPVILKELSIIELMTTHL